VVLQEKHIIKVEWEDPTAAPTQFALVRQPSGEKLNTQHYVLCVPNLNMVPSLLMTPSKTHFKIDYNYSNKLKENRVGVLNAEEYYSEQIHD